MRGCLHVFVMETASTELASRAVDDEQPNGTFGSLKCPNQPEMQRFIFHDAGASETSLVALFTSLLSRNGSGRRLYFPNQAQRLVSEALNSYSSAMAHVGVFFF